MNELHKAKPAGRTLLEALRAYDAKTQSDMGMTGIEKARRNRIVNRLYIYMNTEQRRTERRLCIVAGTDYYGPEDKLRDIGSNQGWRAQ